MPSPRTPKTASPETASVVSITGATVTGVQITQQSLNLLRQILSAEGWCKTIDDIYQGGKLLEEVLPELDPIDWVLPTSALAALSPEDQKAYQEKDRAWTDKMVTVNLNHKQIGVFKKAFEALVNSGKLNPTRFFTELIRVFGLVSDTTE